MPVPVPGPVLGPLAPPAAQIPMFLPSHLLYLQLPDGVTRYICCCGTGSCGRCCRCSIDVPPFSSLSWCGGGYGTGAFHASSCSARPPLLLHYRLLLFLLLLSQLLHLLLHLFPDRLQNPVKPLLLCAYPLTILTVQLAIDLFDCAHPSQSIGVGIASLPWASALGQLLNDFLAWLPGEKIAFIRTSDATTCVSATVLAFSLYGNYSP